MTAKHRPGPWFVEETPDYALIKATDGTSVAMVAHGEDVPVIVTAPELYTALDSARLALRSYQYGNASPDLAAEIADVAADALAKARGEV